jgi:hypothetical protein
VKSHCLNVMPGFVDTGEGMIMLPFQGGSRARQCRSLSRRRLDSVEPTIPHDR